jgi:hypothetical protein
VKNARYGAMESIKIKLHLIFSRSRWKADGGERHPGSYANRNTLSTEFIIHHPMADGSS